MTDDVREVVDADAEEEFVLRNDPPPHRPRKFDNQPDARQDVLFEGLDCLPGQEDLF